MIYYIRIRTGELIGSMFVVLEDATVEVREDREDKEEDSSWSIKFRIWSSR